MQNGKWSAGRKKKKLGVREKNEKSKRGKNKGGKLY